MYVGFNLSEPFRQMPGGEAIQNPMVRRALQHAVDVPTICKQLLNFECVRATGIVNPPNANQSLTPYPYDPDRPRRCWTRPAGPVAPMACASRSACRRAAAAI
jgi:peptide/nickel transport system substrate-binding protein